MPITKVPREKGNTMRIPRSFAKLCKLPPSQFRVLMHGLSYPTRWTKSACIRETGLSEATVKRAMEALTRTGYAYKVPNPLQRKRYGYRFKTQPSLADEDRPWFKEMMRENNGDLSGVSAQPIIDDGKWRYD